MRVSTHSLNATLLNAATRTQASLAEKLVQESTGLVAQTYGGLGTDTARVVNLATELDRAQSWADNAAVAGSRIDAMYSAVGGMTELMTSLRATISAALSSTDNGALNVDAEAVLEELAALMNTKSEGRYLFAGSRTDTVPVDLDAYAYPTDPATADASYYQGDDAAASVRVSETQVVGYGVTAGSGAFEQALRAASVVAGVTTDPLDTATLQAAYDLATEALNGLTTAQSTLSIDAGRLERAQIDQEEVVAYAQLLIDDIKNVDVAQVALEVTQYETLLEASYTAVAKLQDMTLSRYL